MKHIKLNIESMGVISLEHIDEQIANESETMARIGNAVMDLVPNMIHAAKKKFATTKLDKYDLRFLDVNETVLRKAIKPGSYVNISGLPVNVPPGYQGTWPDLMRHLNDSLVHANKIVSHLTGYSTFLASVVSSADGRKGMRDYSGVMKQVDADREKAVTAYNNSFLTNSVKALSTFGKVVDSNEQWFDIIKQLQANMELGVEHKVSVIENLVAEVVALLEAIEKRIANKTFTDISPEALRSLSAMTLTAAREVEFYAITMYRLGEAKKLYENSCEQLIKSLR